jgi:endonuclease/exonuclease/phosphatase family metal-dependent hydrolase
LVVDEMKGSRAGENDVLVVGDFNLVPRKLAAASRLSDWTEGEGSTLNNRGERTSNLYDHVVVDNLGASPELSGKARVIDVRAKSASPQAFERTVSDHLPIAIDIELFQSDDD